MADRDITANTENPDEPGAVERAVNERRNDPEFKARLRRNMEKHADLLDRLADGDSGSYSTLEKD